jgi:hypothetical protein
LSKIITINRVGLATKTSITTLVVILRIYADHYPNDGEIEAILDSLGSLAYRWEVFTADGS